MNSKKPDFSDLSDKIYDFVSSLLEEEIDPSAISIGLVSHAAKLGLQTETDPLDVVGTLFLPIVYQLIEESKSNSGVEQGAPEAARIIHRCTTLQ